MVTPHPMAVVVALGLSFALLAGCTPVPDPTATPAATTASPAPESSPTPEATTTGLSPADVHNIEQAISSGNTAALEAYLADPVYFILPATECCGDITPAEAIANLGNTASIGPWDFALPAATIEAYRASFYYGDLFPADVIVGRAADGTIVAFGIEADRIVSIFTGPEDLIE